MPQQTVSVTTPKPDDTRVPAWAGEYIFWVRWLKGRGLLDFIGRNLKVYRAGGYPGMDGFLFLLGMFSWARAERKGLSISDFDKACAFAGPGMAAVADRKKFPGQAVMSRILAAVPTGEMLLNFGFSMLSSNISSLTSHAAAQVFDALGEAWALFDFDLSSIAIRQRGLPLGGDLPEPMRRAVMALAGHPGRQRGEVIVNGGFLQHAATGLWVQMTMASGNGSMSAMLMEVLPYLEGWRVAAGLGSQRMVVRVDGAGGYMPSLNAFSKYCVDFLARLTCYGLLERPAVMEWLDNATWQLVPDSMSGPTRQVTELGIWPCEDDLTADGAPEGLTQSRVLVTRYPAKVKHGAGFLKNGWHYELFGTSLHAAAWPAPDAVALYFARASLENRFSQLFSELEIKKVFSFQLGGQWLAMLTGLIVSNLRTIAGAEREGPLEFAEVEKTPRVPTATVVSDAAQRAQAQAQAEGPVQRETPAEQAASAQHITITDECSCADQFGQDTIAESSPATGLRPELQAEQVAAHASQPLQDGEQTSEVHHESELTVRPILPAEASPPSPPAAMGPQSSQEVANARPELALLGREDWPTLLRAHTGWIWRKELGMHCPAGKPVRPLEVWTNLTGRAKVSFRTQESDCRACPNLTSCGGPHPRARYCSQIAVTLEATQGADIPILQGEIRELQALYRQVKAPPAAAPAQTAAKTTAKPKPPRSVVPQPVKHAWRAPHTVAPGPWEIQPARLVPSALRKALHRGLADMLVHVEVHYGESPKPPKDYDAKTPAIRQHRRLTWAERLQRNALPPGSTVHTTIEVRDPWVARVLRGGDAAA